MTQNVPASKRTDSALSPVVAEILLTVLTVILVILLLLLVLSCIPNFEFPKPVADDEIPEYFVVSVIDPVNLKIKLKNVGPDIPNNQYCAKIYVNGVEENVVIETLSGHNFIPTHHYGVATLSGAGPTGSTWKQGSSGVLDLKNGLFRSGDTIRVEILYQPDMSVYSSSECTCP